MERAENEYENYMFLCALALLSVLAFYLIRILKEMNGEERELHAMDFVPTQKMAQVHNPFHYVLQGSKSSLKDGVSFTLAVQESCLVLACWGVNIQDIYSVIYQPWPRFKGFFQDVAAAREKLQRISTLVDPEIYVDNVESHTYTMKPSQAVDLGGVPRAKYPLVLFLLEAAAQLEDDVSNMQNHIVCHAIIHHLSDALCPAESHVIAQFVRTPLGYPCNIRPLYTNEEQSYEEVAARPPVPPEPCQHSPVTPDAPGSQHPSAASEQPSSSHEAHDGRDCVENRQNSSGRVGTASAESDTFDGDAVESRVVQIPCIICHMYLVDRVILPCRHVCVCEVCFPKMDRCPMCRGKIESTFRLGGDMRSALYGPVTSDGDAQEDDAELPWWRRWNDRLNNFLGIS